MKDISLDLEMKVSFQKYTEIPGGIVMDAIKAINDAFFNSEMQDFRDIKKEFPEIPSIVFDATENRLRRNRDSAILLRGIEKGSVEIIVVGSALLIYILKQTLGETLKEVWLEGELHRKIKNFLLGRRSEKNNRIKEDTKKRLENRLKAEVESSYSDTLKKAEIGCRIWISPHQEEPIIRRPDQEFD